MKNKRILGIVLFFIGILMFLFANYIDKEVSEGKHKISTAQKQVDTGDSLLSLSPYTEDIGKTAKGGAQKKIDAGQAEVDKYETIALWLHIGGILIGITGIGTFALSYRKR